MKLAELKRKFGTRGEEEIRAEIASLREQRRTFEREHRRLRDDAHAQLDQRIADARAHVELTLRSYGAELLSLPLIGTNLANPSAESLLDLHAYKRFAEDKQFASRLHAAIDTSEGFSELTRPQFEERLARFDSQIAELETELRRRVVEEKEKEAAVARRELEGSVAR